MYTDTQCRQTDRQAHVILEYRYSVKIVQASFKRLPNGKPEFSQIGQVFINISETTANTHYLSSVIEKKWGADNVLVTSDGLRIEDSSGTPGK